MRKIEVTVRGVILCWLLPLLGSIGSNEGFAASALSNPGFEANVFAHTTDVRGWQVYGANTYGENNGSVAHAGNNYCQIYSSFTGGVNYGGVFQDYISAPGTIYTANGWAYTSVANALTGQNAAWLEVTFRDAAANVLALYRSALIATNLMAAGGFPKGQWNNLAITNQYNPATFQITNTVNQLVAPAGTYLVRFQIVYQADANNSPGPVYFDDLNLEPTGVTPYGDMSLTWSDEFSGSAINTSIWTFDLGNAFSWYNNELQYYTSSPNNAFVTNGLLHIVARRENLGGSSYTSARLKTQGLFSWTYGRCEWRAKLPQGVGRWPALWMMGTNITSVNWPGCGEIDVMENNGSTPGFITGATHSGPDGLGASSYYNFIGGDSGTNFHTYIVDRTPNAMLFYVDGHLYLTQTNWTSNVAPYPYPFNQPFFLLMNLAIGGDYVANPSTNAINASGVFPCEMLVDYVRIYTLATTNPPATNAVTVTVDPAAFWNGSMNVLDLNSTWLSNSSWPPADLRATFSNGVLRLAPNTNTYNPANPYWVNPNGSGNKIMDALFYRENGAWAGATVNFGGYCLSNTLVAPYTSTAFIRDFAPDYSSFTFTNVTLVTGQPFNLSMITSAAPGRHVQCGFETRGPNANPATVNNLGGVLITTNAPAVASSPLLSVGVANNAVNLSFPTQTGFTYTLEFKTNLTDATWQTLGNFSGTGSNRIVTNVMNAARGFYRLSMY